MLINVHQRPSLTGADLARTLRAVRSGAGCDEPQVRIDLFMTKAGPASEESGARIEESLDGLSVEAELAQATRRISAMVVELTEVHRRSGGVPHDQAMRVRADAATAAEAINIAVDRLTRASRNQLTGP